MPVSVLASAIICFSQLSSKSRNSWAVFKTLMLTKNHENCSGSLYLRYKHRVKKLGQFIDQVKSNATLKFRKNEVFVSKMHRYPDPSLPRLFLAKSHVCLTDNNFSSIWVLASTRALLTNQKQILSINS